MTLRRSPVQKVPSQDQKNSRMNNKSFDAAPRRVFSAREILLRTVFSDSPSSDAISLYDILSRLAMIRQRRRCSGRASTADHRRASRSLRETISSKESSSARSSGKESKERCERRRSMHRLRTAVYSHGFGLSGLLCHSERKHS